MRAVYLGISSVIQLWLNIISIVQKYPETLNGQNSGSLGNLCDRGKVVDGSWSIWEAVCAEGVAKLPCRVPKLRDVEMGCWEWIGVLVGGIEVMGLPSWCTATDDCAFEWRGELVWGNRRRAELRSLQTYRTVITIMLRSKIKLKQTLNNVGNITVYKSLIVAVSLQFSIEAIGNRS